MADYNGQFVEACKCGQMEEAKRLVRDHQVGVDMDDGFRRACEYGHSKMASTGPPS